MTQLFASPSFAQGDRFAAFEKRIAELVGQAHYDQAVKVGEDYRRTARARAGDVSAHHARALSWLGHIYQQGFSRADRSIPLYEEALSIYRRLPKKFGFELSNAANNLAVQYQTQGRYDSAGKLLSESLEIKERFLAPNDPRLAPHLSNLAQNYRYLNRLDDAKRLHRRAFDLLEKTQPENHPLRAASRQNLGSILELKGELKAAERMFREAVKIKDVAYRRDHPEIAGALNKLAENLYLQKQYDEAAGLMRRVLEIRRKSQPRYHDDTSAAWMTLGRIQIARKRYGAAEQAFNEALTIRRKIFPETHPTVAVVHAKLASVAHLRGSNQIALERARRASQIYIARGGLDANSKAHFRDHILYAWLAYREIPSGRERQKIVRESFLLAQRALTTVTEQTVKQLTARLAATDKRLERTVRRRQDLAAEQERVEQLLVDTLSGSRGRSPKNVGKARASLKSIKARRAKLDRELKRRYPGYKTLVDVAPLTTTQTKNLLNGNEALMIYLVASEEVFAWSVTRERIAWSKVGMSPLALNAKVADLRRSMEIESIEGDLSFSLTNAFQLYSALFDPFRDQVPDKSSLLVVASGVLTSLPFHMLVTKRPRIAKPTSRQLHALRDAAWLLRQHAVVVLPAVSSLAGLRQAARASVARKAFIGFGNPLLNGPDARFADLARSARRAQRCKPLPNQRVARISSPTNRSIAPFSLQRGIVPTRVLLAQTPLPETADELCAVASALSTSTASVMLGARATEAEVKRLSRQAKLAQYRIVHFATHGTLAGQIAKGAEAGLILTPPGRATQGDDGYLSASEISTLKLDAEWVILSACNTAGPSGSGAEALSGLARSFFYAGARALLVSHWDVFSEQTVKLITRTIAGMSDQPELSRAEALRRAMLRLIDQGLPHEAHPAFWAPFVVVGQGGRRRN